jgi:2-C-methyl-D-erythritol 4-phosphate cytidylyltransferase/2-C-methyl-D-erythritol 2,4-cyclodiphosphate synthase
MIAHAIDGLLSHRAIDDVQVVIGAGQEALFAEAVAGRPLPAPVIGGATRRDSVRAGLAAIAADRVLIHDAARPFLPAAVIDRLLAALDEGEAAVPVLPVVDTLALGTATLGDTVPRDGLHRVQTPQAFHLAAIRRAHDAWTGGEATDDAQVARAAGIDVTLVAGDRRLEKLTHEADFAEADRRLRAAAEPRTGFGHDVHAFAEGDHVWLCGVKVAHSYALAGHSDADVGLHALTDALLATIAAGDIGQHFPPSDPQWRGAASDRFLIHARDLVTRAGGRIAHVDVTLICEAPKVGPHRDAMRGTIARLLGIDEGRVSVKATTTEGLGFTGRREGIAASAVATVMLENDRCA